MARRETHTRAREYETIYILRSDTNPDAADQVANRVTEVIERLKGKLVKVDNWGRRRLSYPIQGATRGVFVYVRYVGFEDLVAELERNLKLLDPIVRCQTMQLRASVKLEDVTVNPEETTFARLEAPDASEEEPGLTQRLGLEQPPRRRIEEREERAPEEDREEAEAAEPETVEAEPEADAEAKDENPANEPQSEVQV